jgi:hypothetical protein
MSDKDDQIREMLDNIVDYEQTVHALLLFSALVVHDGKARRPGAEFGFGRRMHTSGKNPIEPNTDVTPDLVAQKSPEYGIVVEAKKSLPRDSNQWEVHAQRLRKYDDELTGWWTGNERIEKSDAAMLVHQSRGRLFSRYLAEFLKKAALGAQPNACVVEFNQSSETVTYYFFRAELGTIRDVELSTLLDRGINVPLDDVIESFSHIRYYDAEPPRALLLEHLWTAIFPSLLDEAEGSGEGKEIRLPVSISRITEEMQRAHGSGAMVQDKRSVEFPKTRWIKDALESLAQYRLAMPPQAGQEEYIVLYRGLRGDVRQRFIDMQLRASLKKGERGVGEQMPLPMKET